MANPATAFLSRLVRKLAMAAMISALAWAALALWVYTRDRADFEEHRSGQIAGIVARKTAAREALDAAAKAADEAKAAIETQRQRMAQADKALATLKEIEPGALDRVFGDKDAVESHAARVAKLQTLRTEAQTRTVELQRDLVAAETGREAATLLATELARQETGLREESYAAEHYLRAAWHMGRWALLAVFLGYLFGGLLVATVLYFGWARVVVRGRPMKLEPAGKVLPVTGESTPVLEDSLWPGEYLWVRRRFLHGNDDELARRGRFLLSRRHPFSCLAGGLGRLVELRNTRSGGERRVVFSCADDPFAELVLVSVPEDGAFVVRLGLVAGYIGTPGSRPVIRRHWRFFSWQSWVSGRFGYLEFRGPCRLVVAGVSAMSVETLSGEGADAEPGRRVPQAGLVGFSPGLSLRPERSESFWRYCRRLAPLFDLCVAGAGVAVHRGAEGRARDGLRGRMLKRMGL